jgi:hypothetical protein
LGALLIVLSRNGVAETQKLRRIDISRPFLDKEIYSFFSKLSKHHASIFSKIPTFHHPCMAAKAFFDRSFAAHLLPNFA